VVEIIKYRRRNRAFNATRKYRFGLGSSHGYFCGDGNTIHHVLVDREEVYIEKPNENSTRIKSRFHKFTSVVTSSRSRMQKRRMRS
jgi:hypothetical protein